MPLSFRLTTIFYVMALLAAALAAFGAWGALAAAFVLAVWIWVRAAQCPTIAGVIVLTFGCVIALFPPLENSRTPSVRNDCHAILRDIAIGLQNYHDVYGCFPPPYLTDSNGAPAHSWRVLILPFIEEQPLYSLYRFDEPWNGPNNRKLADLIPIIYRCPGKPRNEEPGCTSYFAVVGENAAWRSDRPRNLSEFADGPSETILVIENCAKTINWMEPIDISYEEALRQLTTKSYSGHRRGDYYFSDCNVCFADGHAKWVWPFERPTTAAALLTLDAHDQIDEDSVYREVEGQVMNKGFPAYFRLVPLTLFVALSLLPAFRLRRLNPPPPAPAREPSPS